ncbi:MAG TPA: CopD family protein, partial [Amaricoccus sp.]|nr:CopD family protein [Amaricoccus sp.]
RPRAEGSRLRVPVPAGLGSGTQILSWRVVSADGHPVGGSHLFSIGAPSETAAPEGGGGIGGAAWAAAVARGALTLALTFGVGGAVYLRWVDRAAATARARRFAAAAAWAALPLAAAALGLHGLDLLDAPAAALAGGAAWRAALASPFAATALASALAGLAAAAALRREGAAAAGLAAAAWALAAVSFALFGHAATAPPRWLTAPAVALHAAGFIFWIGALPWLAARAAAPGGPPPATLRRFSALAVPLVAGIVLSGAILALVQVGRPSALIATAYGRLLLAKLALVALLLLLAALNRFRLTPGIARGDGAAARRFRRSVAAEILLGLLVLVLASGFRLTPPPRVLALAVPQAAHAHAHGSAAMADVTVTPGRAGANVVEIRLMASDFGPLDPLEVGIAFSDPERGVEPIRLEAARDGSGGWRAGPVQLPHPGRWTLTLDVLVSDFVQERLGTTATIGP